MGIWASAIIIPIAIIIVTIKIFVIITICHLDLESDFFLRVTTFVSFSSQREEGREKRGRREDDKNHPTMIQYFQLTGSNMKQYLHGLPLCYSYKSP